MLCCNTWWCPGNSCELEWRRWCGIPVPIWEFYYLVRIIVNGMVRSRIQSSAAKPGRMLIKKVKINWFLFPNLKPTSWFQSMWSENLKCWYKCFQIMSNELENILKAFLACFCCFQVFAYLGDNRKLLTALFTIKYQI